MKILEISCFKPGQLIEKQSFMSLSLLEKLQLHFHTGVYSFCKNHQIQRRSIDRGFNHLFTENGPELTSNEALKTRILNKLL